MDRISKCKGELRVVRELANQRRHNVLRWFGHVKRMEKECSVRKITRSGVRSVRPKGRQGIGWINTVKRVIDARGMPVGQRRVVVILVHDRSGQSIVVNA